MSEDEAAAPSESDAEEEMPESAEPSKVLTERELTEFEKKERRKGVVRRSVTGPVPPPLCAGFTDTCVAFALHCIACADTPAPTAALHEACQTAPATGHLR